MLEYRIIENDDTSPRSFELKRDRRPLAAFHQRDAAVNTARAMARLDVAQGDDVVVSVVSADGSVEVVTIAFARPEYSKPDAT